MTSLDAPDAVAADGPDTGVAWHFGSPSREQKLLADGAAVVDLSHRGVVTVTGPDRLTWLDTLSTQWLRDLTPGVSAEALILSPHGHVENALHVVDDGQTLWLGVEPGAGEPLVAHLEKMRFLLRVEIADRSAQFATLALVRGGLADRVLTPSAAQFWDDPWPTTAPGGEAYNPVDDASHPGAERAWRELFISRERLDEAMSAALDAGVSLAGTWASEALRVAALRPRFGVDTDHRTIPHELDWLRTAVHLNKGCYRGQETVARVRNLGRPPRRIVLLHLDGSEHALPEAGAPVMLGDRQVGRITSAVRHYEDGPLALAVVKSSVSQDETLTVGGIAAAQSGGVVAARR
ncbi:MAG: YgfZ/GcvT domain-containing protein [Actinomycetales bacterium]